MHNIKEFHKKRFIFCIPLKKIFLVKIFCEGEFIIKSSAKTRYLTSSMLPISHAKCNTDL